MSGKDLFYERILHLNDNQTKFTNLSDVFNEQKDFCSESIIKCSILSIIFCLLIICTIIGNSFVIAAVILERNLHSVANYLIVSLAIADLTVSVMVNTFFLIFHEIKKTRQLLLILFDLQFLIYYITKFTIL